MNRTLNQRTTLFSPLKILGLLHDPPPPDRRHGPAVVAPARRRQQQQRSLCAAPRPRGLLRGRLHRIVRGLAAAPGPVQAVRLQPLVQYREGEQSEASGKHTCNVTRVIVAQVMKGQWSVDHFLFFWLDKVRTPSRVYVEPVEEEILHRGSDPERHAVLLPLGCHLFSMHKAIIAIVLCVFVSYPISTCVFDLCLPAWLLAALFLSSQMEPRYRF